MVKVNTRWKTAEDFNLLRGTSAWTKVQYFWRKGWIEIPVTMGTSFLALLGTGMIFYTVYYGVTHDMTPKYYNTLKIYRPDDPEVKKIRHTSLFDDK
ncbi:uncharacterized protein LOC105202838 [Solenopsis invicta]|uniref:uncharacterized protein LOC105202838 n=1 Tax=Solenopsis invicta TaxID=13686 RepID=UPI0001FE88B7|nr:uncharacterized protein LOC105202838 [Solenopsis invicta]